MSTLLIVSGAGHIILIALVVRHVQHRSAAIAARRAVCSVRFLEFHNNAYAMNDLLVYDIEAHRSQRHAGHNVDGAEPGGGIRLPSQSRQHVPKADGRQAHEAEVDAVDEGPILQAIEHCSAEYNVDDHHGKAEQYGCQNAQPVHGATRLAGTEGINVHARGDASRASCGG